MRSGSPGRPRRSARSRRRPPPRRRRPAGSTGRTARARGGRPARASGRRPSGTRPRSTGARRAGPARASSAAAAARSSSVKPMSIVPGPRLAPGPGREVGQAVEQQHDLTTGPAWRQPAGRRQAGERARCAAGRRWRAPRARELAPVREHHADRAPSSTSTRSDLRLERAPRAPAASAAARSAPVTAPIPPRAIAPRAGRRRPPRRGRGRRPTNAVPGSSGPASVPISPWSANGTRTSLRGDARQVVGDRAVEDLRADRLEPALAVGAARASAGGARVGRGLPALAPTPRSRRRRRAPQSRSSWACVRSAVGPRDDLAPVGERREQVGLVDVDAQPVRRQVELAR